MITSESVPKRLGKKLAALAEQISKNAEEQMAKAERVHVVKAE